MVVVTPEPSQPAPGDGVDRASGLRGCYTPSGAISARPSEEARTIDPHNPDGDTAIGHRRTEEGIERQLAWLKEQDVIDDEDTFDLRIDYTTHNYSKHSPMTSDPPIGVHKQPHLETGYAWKEPQGTIKINIYGSLEREKAIQAIQECFETETAREIML